jgi:predicted NAD-dependent protein-ADP-ribosyltransferase YbiA (DUF1768 family)
MENKTEISFTKVALPFGWLGNMSPYPITFLGKEWRTTEALFQALRFDDEEIIEAIRLEKSPMGAKMKAKKHRASMIVIPMGERDVGNMKFCIAKKINAHPTLLKLLNETGEIPIYEDVTSRPRGSGLFWGAKKIENTWEGQNVLGKIWMETRDMIKCPLTV